MSGGSLSSNGGIDGPLLAGIAAYRRHPWCRDLADPPVIWTEGGSRILEYSRDGPRVLFVPSLVNRAHILDLTEERSMLRWLAGQGLSPLLLDWGWPGVLERGFSLTDYIAGRLERALVAVGGPVVMAGYCMGGLLALAAAIRRPELVRALVLLATPWDFAQPDPEPARRLAAALPMIEQMMAISETLPIDALQAAFAAQDRAGIAAKFRTFGQLDQAGDQARQFVALEDWLNDGIPLAAPVARDCIRFWYGENATVTLRWRVAGGIVDPASLDLPCFVAIPARDRIVPPESARPLVDRLRAATCHVPRAGHVGMVAGSRAQAELWSPLRDWLRALLPPI